MTEAEESRAAAGQFNGGGDAEDRELRRLTARANVGNVYMAAMEHRSVVGRQRPNCNHIMGWRRIRFTSIHMLRLPTVEHRATTTAPSNVATMQDDPIQPVFAMGAGAFLGIDRPTVPMGDAVYPVLTNAADGGRAARGFVGRARHGQARTMRTCCRRIGFKHRSPTGGRTLRASAGWIRAYGQALNMGLEEKLDFEAIGGTNGLLERHESGEPQCQCGDEFRELHFGVLFWACRRKIRGHADRRADRLRRVVVRACGQHAYRSNNADYSALDALMS